MYGRRLTAQQKDERQQDNDDKKRLVRHHPSDLLCSLTREWIGGVQHGIVSPALRDSPFRYFHVLRVRHLMRMHIPSHYYYHLWKQSFLVHMHIITQQLKQKLLICDEPSTSSQSS